MAQISIFQALATTGERYSLHGEFSTPYIQGVLPALACKVRQIGILLIDPQVPIANPFFCIAEHLGVVDHPARETRKKGAQLENQSEQENCLACYYAIGASEVRGQCSMQHNDHQSHHSSLSSFQS